MEDSLGNNAKTLMFVNCSPSIYNESETKNSLEYAKRVKEIKNNPTLNIETKNMAIFKKKLSKQSDLIDALKGLVSDNGLGDKLAEIMASMAVKKDDDEYDDEEDGDQEEEESV